MNGGRIFVSMHVDKQADFAAGEHGQRSSTHAVLVDRCVRNQR